MLYLQGFCKKKGYANKTSVTKVADGGEPTEFKNLFNSWPVPQTSGKAYIASGKIGMIGVMIRWVLL